MKLLNEDNANFPLTKTLTKGSPSLVSPGENGYYTIDKGKVVALKPKTQQVTVKILLNKKIFKKITSSSRK